jgi:flavin-dependent dehydrogenase
MASSSAETVDVAIIGGGPAGAAAGRLLASWGHRVVMVHHAPSVGRALGESLPPSIRSLFQTLGVLQSIEGAGYYRATGNTVWWADAPKRVEWFGGEREPLGYQVRRDEFDQQLRTLASDAGVRMLCGIARVQEMRGALAVVAVDGISGRKLVRAPFLLDCSGRAGICARLGFRRPETAFQTLAIGAVWRNGDGWRRVVDDPTHTIVETYCDGWAWSVPIASDRRFVTVMIDPRYSLRRAPGDLTSTYRRELAKTRAMTALTKQAVMSTSPNAYDASLYTAARFADDTVLLVGDSGSFVDPLSSYGVKKAIASGWRAAVVVNTCLTRVGARSMALEYFCDREAHVYETFLRQSGQYFRQAHAAYNHPFWADRAAAVDRAPLSTPNDVEQEIRTDREVRAAFEWVKGSPAIALRRCTDVRIERRPEIVGRHVVLEDVLVSDALPSGVRFIAGVNLPGLVSIASTQNQVPALFEAYNLRYAPVSLSDFLRAFSVLLGKRIVTDELYQQN